MSTISTIDIPVNAADVDFNCPSWCITDHIGTGELYHDSAYARLTEGDKDVASVFLSSAFTGMSLNGRLVLSYSPTLINLSGECNDMTVKKARELAALLLKVADQAEATESARRAERSVS